MAAKNRGKSAPVPSEEDKRRKHQFAMACLGVVKVLGLATIIGLCVVWFGYVIIYLPIQAAHGETTTISVAQNWLANVYASVYFAWGTTAAVGIGWRRTYNKMIRERKQKDARIAELERRLDPGRTSSGLTPEGGAGQ